MSDSSGTDDNFVMEPVVVSRSYNKILRMLKFMAFFAVGMMCAFSFYTLDDHTWYMVEIQLYRMFEYCISPALDFVAKLLFKLFAINALFNLLSRKLAAYPRSLHLISTVLGLFLLYILLKDAFVLYIFVFWLMFTINQAFKTLMQKSYLSDNKATLLAKTGVICLLLYFEFFMKNRELWTKSRGVLMVQAMKFISLTRMFERDYPTLLECLGYVFFPGTLIFGPWIPYATYIGARLYNFPRTTLWIQRLIICTILIPLNLILSNCVSQLIYDDNYRWYAAYLKALSFRTSHYFISYISEFSLVAAGYRDNTRVGGHCGYTITNPKKIELPSSLKTVVVNWNIPIHTFLKENVYKAWIHTGKFPAIIITFFVSALLHGLNLPITLILLSLGFSSFVEYKLRATLSYHLNMCVGADECKRCQHQYKNDNIIARAINFVFSLLTIIHLLYLGAIMEIGNKAYFADYVKYWKSLNFVGHYMAFGMFVLTLFSSY